MNRQKDNILGLIKSWGAKDSSISKMVDIFSWIKEKNTSLKMDIKKNRLSDSNYWFLDDAGIIRSRNDGFFKIAGLKQYRGVKVVAEQPIMLQEEIGYLGILCKEIDGLIHLLMQAKIEPGNINKIQISPTIQATKSNFMQKHGGKKTAYLDKFMEASTRKIIFDQIQSEQSSRFYKKRNRNILIMLDESDEVEVLKSHKWMTLGQVKILMKEHNLVNMDTRTVLSCIPFSLFSYTDDELMCIENIFENKNLFKSAFLPDGENHLPEIFSKINDRKMFDEKKTDICSLLDLPSWLLSDESIEHKSGFDFKVVFCDINIEGREVKQWTQPLFEALGNAIFGLVCTKIDNCTYFLVKLKEEAGIFDTVELSPTIQLESRETKTTKNKIEEVFWHAYSEKKNVLYDTILSEEGGRFYHEENYNIIIEIDEKNIVGFDDEYILLDYYTLNQLVQYNNVLNIQLRNLLSLLEV